MKSIFKSIVGIPASFAPGSGHKQQNLGTTLVLMELNTTRVRLQSFLIFIASSLVFPKMFDFYIFCFGVYSSALQTRFSEKQEPHIYNYYIDQN